MITRKTELRFTANGQEFKTLREAQEAELSNLLGQSDNLIDALLDKAPAVVDILTTTERSLTRARKVNRGRKPRKAKVAATMAKFDELVDDLKAHEPAKP